MVRAWKKAKDLTKFPAPKPTVQYEHAVGPQPPTAQRQYIDPIGPKRPPSTSQKVGQWLHNRADAFKENARRPMWQDEPPRPKPSGKGKRAPAMSGPVIREIPFPSYGGIDFSLHPDPMVSGMYRKPKREEHKKHREGGATEIHYHYY